MAKGIQLSRWAGMRWIIAFVLVAVAMLGGGYALGYYVQGEQRAIESNANEPVIVTAAAEERTPEPAPISVKIGTASTFEVRSAPPKTAVAAVITRSPYTVGETLREGSLLLAVSNEPRFVLLPTTPLFRDLALGMEGPDVQSLNDALARAGFIGKSPGEVYNWITRVGVVAMYAKAGFDAPGENPGDLLPADVVVRPPQPDMTVASIVAVNTEVPDDAVLLSATSPITTVVARFDVVQVESVAVGTPVSLSIPGRDGTVGGTVSGVSDFKEASDEEGSFPGYDVTVTLDEPLTAGAGLVASLSVASTVPPVLAVPVTAIRDGGSTTFVRVKNGEKFVDVDVTVTGEGDGWAYLSSETELAVGDIVRVAP